MIGVPPGARLVISNVEGEPMFSTNGDGIVVIRDNDISTISNGWLVVQDRMYDEKWPDTIEGMTE